MGEFGVNHRDAYLALDNSTGQLLGTMILETPERRFDVSGGCEQTDDGYANFWFTLVEGGQPFYGTIYEADDGNVYIEGKQDVTNRTFVLRRQD